MIETPHSSENTAVAHSPEPETAAPAPHPETPPEIGGREGPEPTRFGDWEKNGRCIDF
ncbi:MAG: DUF1674 domain-containing protein [Arenimonas sp.]